MLDIIGIVLIIGGIVAIVKKPNPEAKRKTTPGVAIAMIVSGALVLVFSEIILSRYLAGK